MIVSVKADRFGGTINAIPSKSYAHRMLICAALSRKDSILECSALSEDIEATVDCLNALGADIRYQNGSFHIHPIDRNRLPEISEIDCRESGSTLRFILPVVCALGIRCDVVMRGRLPERPLSPMYEELVAHGVSLSPQGVQPFHVEGQLQDPHFSIAANVSSQFISGLLFALPLLGGGTLQMTGEVQSGSYIEITLECMRKSGIRIEYKDRCFIVSGEYDVPAVSVVQGDWSNAAFWLCAGAVGLEPVTVRGLIADSSQGDRKIIDVIHKFGGNVIQNGDSFISYPSKLHSITLDASDIPDLVPVISVLAMQAAGETVIEHAERLRIKESDRIASVCQLLRCFGADVKETHDGMRIVGGGSYHGGVIDSWNDHRIAMTAAVASLLISDAVMIQTAECVNKSYPGFYRDYRTLGGTVEEVI